MFPVMCPKLSRLLIALISDNHITSIVNYIMPLCTEVLSEVFPLVFCISFYSYSIDNVV